MQNHDNSRDLRPAGRVTFGLVDMSTLLRKRSHDRHHKIAVLLRAHERDAQADLDAWKSIERLQAAGATITRKEATK